MPYGRDVKVTQIRVHVYVSVRLVVSGVATAALITVGPPMISAVRKVAVAARDPYFPEASVPAADFSVVRRYG